jgi:hypothetical protein
MKMKNSSQASLKVAEKSRAASIIRRLQRQETNNDGQLLQANKALRTENEKLRAENEQWKELVLRGILKLLLTH